MGAVIFGPEWFFGKDSIIDFLCVFVLLLIGYFSLRVYNIKKAKSYLNLAIALGLLALSFLVKIGISLGGYFSVLNGSGKNAVFVFQFIYQLLTLGGFYMLYSTYQKQSGSSMFLFGYLTILITLLSRLLESLFHFTSFVLMLVITMLSVQKYIKAQYPTSKLLSISFGIITFSHLLFVFDYVNPVYYVGGEIVQLAGYLTLLVTFIVVLLYGRKKNENRYYW